jgi:two-component system sensor histidine kinase RegB
MTEAGTKGARAAPLEVHWLPRLRWAAILALLVSIAGTRWLLRAPFPTAPLVGVVALLSLVNVALLAHLRRKGTLSERAVTAHLLVDTSALTALLVWTGGAMNPFTTLYLLHVALAGVLVGRAASLLVAGFAVLCFGALLLARPEAIHVWHSASMFDLHVRGMWVAFALTALCLWFFVGRVSDALRASERQLARAQLDAARAERLAAVGALAAGVAHELNTPLGTVAILAAELRDTLTTNPAALAQLDALRAEVKRCKLILSRMRPPDDSGVDGARVEPVALGPWAIDVSARWQSNHAECELTARDRSQNARAMVSSASLEIALSGLLDNARRAQRDASVSAPIELEVSLAQGELRVTVRDRGAGMAPEVVARASEPFFTTRETGDGMGLGLFLTRATVERAGGRLELESRPGDTRATLVLPVCA